MSGETLVGSTAHYRFDGGGGASAQHRFGSQSQLGHPGKDELGNCRNTLRARPTPRVPFCGFDRYCSGFVQYIGIPTFRREAPSLGWRLKRHIETKKKYIHPVAQLLSRATRIAVLVGHAVMAAENIDHLHNENLKRVYEAKRKRLLNVSLGVGGYSMCVREANE